MEKKIIVLICVLGLIFGLLLILSPLNMTTPNQSYKLYKQGLSFYQTGDFQNAYYNFGKIGSNAHIYPIAIYRQAICALELKDYPSAAKKFKKYTRIMKDENLVPVGYWELGELYYGSKNYSYAQKYFKDLQKKYPKSDFSYAANYKLGEISLEKKNPAAAKEYFIKYLDHAPMGRYAFSCIENLNPADLNAREKLILGISLYKNGEFKVSIDVLNSIKDDTKWYYLGKNYLATGKKDMARDCFLKALQTMQKEDGEVINDCVANYLTLSGTSKAEAGAKLVSAVKNPNTIPGILFIHAHNDPKVAISNYNRIYKQNPNGFYAAESLWEIFWNFYKHKKYQDALKIAQIHSSKFLNSNSAPKILYFSGRIHQKMNDKVVADKFFKKILDDYPNHYYAYRANGQITRTGGTFQTIRSVPLKEQAKITPLPLQNDYLSELLLVQDFEAIESFKIQDEFLKSWLARARGSISYSIVLARDEMAKTNRKPDKDNVKWKLIYPVYYNKIINTMAQSATLSPELVIAIIKEESFFDAYARSHAGAVGLMQLMPATAQHIEKEDYNPSKLNEPYYNIYLGSKYFANLKKQFGGNELFAVASYNGGPGNVIKWKNEFFNGDLDEFVENIPYQETKNYVKKIYGSYWNYLRIYGK